ncbi:S9 family peptidase [Spirosoma fluminis]
MLRFILILLVLSGSTLVSAQRLRAVRWTDNGNSYLSIKDGSLVQTAMATGQTTVVVPKEILINPATSQPIQIANYDLSADRSVMLVYTNTARVWRQNTRGDYYVVRMSDKQVRQVGKDRPAKSLMFAKLSPDGRQVAYVSEHNLFVEDVATGQARQLTTDGTRKRINGTFDWAYEEEFGCRDGFRWSPDGKQIAYWQVDATGIRDYLMLNNTDSTYSFTIPVEYPKVGEAPSPARLGVVNIGGGVTTWLPIPGDPKQHYLVRMEWLPNSPELIVQQLNRKQNQSTIFICPASGAAPRPIHSETDKAWVDCKDAWNGGDPSGWEWVNGGKAFLWVSEKDGWRHLYRIGLDSRETLLTPGQYDIANIELIDEKGGYVYFLASPQNPTQRYLHRVRMDGKGKLERITPTEQVGTHDYDLSPNGQWALHSLTSHTIPTSREWLRLPDHKPAAVTDGAVAAKPVNRPNLQFFAVTTDEGVTLDAWMAKPTDFDSTKKYPVLFYVYGEPASTTTNDVFSTGMNSLFAGDMAKAGYCYIAVDNRGTPTLKGAAWRKSIYRQIGRLNVRDQAMAAKKLMQQHSYLDTSRVAVWGWSGGGSTTLHLLFQYPDIYKTGIAVAAVGNQLLYDNIYQERYMGLPQENREDFVAGSPITYAKNLRGNLLYIHGTGDDNVHYANAEQLINELIKHNKQFQVMPYPNRSHGISEGAGTTEHLRTLYTKYLTQHCPPGAR